MADGTAIEWTDATWNPITGCSVVSPGCTNCYAMRLAGTRLRNHATRIGLTRDTKAGPVWTGDIRFNARALTDPLRWTKPRMIFVCAHGDLFHENVQDEWIDRIFAVMALCPQHTFQVLTKRSARMRSYMTAFGPDRCDNNRMYEIDQRVDEISANLGKRHEIPAWPLPNVWLGVSAEDQTRADERIPDLLATPADVRWVSAEPLLGRIDFTRIPSPVVVPEDEGYYHSSLDRSDIHYRNGDPDILTGRVIVDAVDGPMMERIDWVVIGGESGPHARPMHPQWARDIRDQCAAAGVPFFFKQHGEWIGVPDLRNLPDGRGPGFGAYDHCKHDMDAECVRVGKKAAGRHLDGREHNAMPAIVERLAA